ncbi:MAG: hypothetical protein ACO3JL_17235, partial [Myxococcota bacterium]
GGPAASGGGARGTVRGVGLSLLCEGGKLAVDAGACDFVADLLGNPTNSSASPMGAPVEGARAAFAHGERTLTEDQAQRSHNLEMERLKLLMQRMQQMQQALSNVLNTMHEGAMNSIRNIK